MRQFRWISGNEIPFSCDLRRCGWVLAAPDFGESGAPGEPGAVAIAHVASMEAAHWVNLLGLGEGDSRRWIILVGVDSGEERARCLDLGFGDALPASTGLGEIDARARRVAVQAMSLPGERKVEALRLDLLARDGFVAGRPLGLHPREFALAWRLTRNPGAPVSKRQLLADVWRMRHVPETNSLAVHVFRLRAKLALAGLEGMVETDADGCYRLAGRSGAGPSSGRGAPAMPAARRTPVRRHADDHARYGFDDRQHAPRFPGFQIPDPEFPDSEIS